MNIHVLSFWEISLGSIIVMILAPWTINNIFQSSTKIASNTDESIAKNVYNPNARRIQHCLSGCVIYGLSYIIPIYYHGIGLLWVGVCLLLYLDKYKARQIVQNQFSNLIRPSQGLEGAIWFLIGVVLSAHIFPLQNARVGLLCLSFGDPMSSYFSSGDENHRKKSWYSAFACWVSCLLAVLGFMIPVKDNISLQKAFLAAVSCTLAEFFIAPSLKIDDNFLIPILTATSLTIYDYIVYKSIFQSYER